MDGRRASIMERRVLSPIEVVERDPALSAELVEREPSSLQVLSPLLTPSLLQEDPASWSHVPHPDFSAPTLPRSNPPTSPRRHVRHGLPHVGPPRAHRCHTCQDTAPPQRRGLRRQSPSRCQANTRLASFLDRRRETSRPRNVRGDRIRSGSLSPQRLLLLYAPNIARAILPRHGRQHPSPDCCWPSSTRPTPQPAVRRVSHLVRN